jgi:IS30 family transposase
MKIDNQSLKQSRAFANTLNTTKTYTKMTYDNGMEMANHKWLTDKTGIDIYFAHPYSSWEHGTNENTNGLRRFFLKN